MKVLVIGDSYGLPRLHKKMMRVELSYEETYPEQMRQVLRNNYREDILLVNRCRHANTSYSLVRGEANEIMFLHPEYVIVQLGLTDLWPSSLRNVPPIQKDLEGKDPWVSEEEYQRHLRSFIGFVLQNESKAIVVNVPKVGDDILRKQPQVGTRIIKYNSLVKQICDSIPGVAVVDLYGMIEKLGSRLAIGSDGIHPTPFASTELAMSVCGKINTYSNSEMLTKKV